MRVLMSLSFFSLHPFLTFFFFFNDTATTEIYTLSLHDALPILPLRSRRSTPARTPPLRRKAARLQRSCPGRISSRTHADRKSTRLNSSHSQISYAVFCLKKKKKIKEKRLNNKIYTKELL